MNQISAEKSTLIFCKRTSFITTSAKANHFSTEISANFILWLIALLKDKQSEKIAGFQIGIGIM